MPRAGLQEEVKHVRRVSARLELVGFLGEIDPDNSRVPEDCVHSMVLRQVPDPKVNELPEAPSLGEAFLQCQGLVESTLEERRTQSRSHLLWEVWLRLRVRKGTLDEALKEERLGETQGSVSLAGDLS